MRRKPIIVVVSNFYRVGAEWLSVEAWRDVAAWMTTTNKNCFRIKREDAARAVLPYKSVAVPVLAWIDLLNEADRRNQTHVYRSFVDAMERRVKARLYSEDWESTTAR